MERDQKRSRTLQFLQGSPQNNEAVWHFFLLFRAWCPYTFTILNQVLVLGPSFGGYPWLHGCMCHIIGAT